MLATRLRVRPCNARCSPRSVGRCTVRVPSSCSIFMSEERSCSSWPFGPLTTTCPGAMSISTPSGIAIGFLPIRLISPDVGDYLAANSLRLCLVAGHDAARGADDRGAGPAIHPGDRVVVHVAAAARSRDALDAADHRLLVVRVLELNANQLADPSRMGREVGDVALLLQDP